MLEFTHFLHACRYIVCIDTPGFYAVFFLHKFLQIGPQFSMPSLSPSKAPSGEPSVVGVNGNGVNDDDYEYDYLFDYDYFNGYD